MIAMLLAVTMAVQGPGALMPGTGIVTGALKTADGKPAAGVRVGAVDIDDPSASSLLSVSETDAQGRYRLINIPAGNYYIVAGRLNDLKYFPSGERTAATQNLIEPARTRADVNFTVPAGTERPVTTFRGGLRVRPSPHDAEFQQIAAEKDPERKARLIAQFEKTYPLSPRLAEAYLSLMNVYAARNDLARMLEFGDKAVNSVSADINTHIQVSRSYASLRAQTVQMNRAIAYAEKAVSLSKGLTAESTTKGPLLVQWQKWKESVVATAQQNLTWVRQVDAWQRRALTTLVTPTRR